MTETKEPELPAGESAAAAAGDRGAARILAIDLGDRRIGLALSDPLGFTAQPLFTLHRTNLRADLKSIGRVVRKHGVSAMVLGLPLHASGEMSAQARKSEAFAGSLREQHPGVPVHLLDERLTTVEAHALLDRSGSGRRSKRSREERSAMVDQVAAVLLLEAYLSSLSPRLLPPPPEPE